MARKQAEEKCSKLSKIGGIKAAAIMNGGESVMAAINKRKSA